MDIERLKNFLIEPTDKFEEPPINGESPFDVICFAFRELNDIFQYGDSQLKDIRIAKSDALNSLKGCMLLESMIKSREPHPEVRDPSVILPNLLKSIDKLTENYYRRKIAFIEERIPHIEKGIKDMWNRYEFLLKSSLTDPSALDTLQDEFYPNYEWNPDREEIPEPPENVSVASLPRIKQRHDMRAEFKATVSELRSHGAGLVAMIGRPLCIENLECFLDNHKHTLKRNQRAMEGVIHVAASLRAITAAAPVAAPPLAKIYEFPQRPTSPSPETS